MKRALAVQFAVLLAPTATVVWAVPITVADEVVKYTVIVYVAFSLPGFDITPPAAQPSCVLAQEAIEVWIRVTGELGTFVGRTLMPVTPGGSPPERGVAGLVGLTA